MINSIEMLGIFAGICTTFSFLPQIKKVWISRSAKDISLHMYIVYCSGLLLWTMYGILMESVSLILANFITFIFAFSILIMKLRWRSRE
jgi:MtN3 and saliva related transmembrane protein